MSEDLRFPIGQFDRNYDTSAAARHARIATIADLPQRLRSAVEGFSEEQIVGVLKEAEAGVPMKDLCRRIGISGATFYHWKAKYGGLEVNEARRLRQVEEENGRLKRIVAQQALDLDALKVVLAKKW